MNITNGNCRWKKYIYLRKINQLFFVVYCTLTRVRILLFGMVACVGLYLAS